MNLAKILDFMQESITKLNNFSNCKLLIALTSLCAEGTPVLVLEMCKWWLASGIQPQVVTFNLTPDDLASEFQEIGIPIICLDLPQKGYVRYGQMLRKFNTICRQFQPDAVLSMPLGWHTFIAYGARLAGVRQIAAHVGNYPPHWTGRAFSKFRLLIQLGRPVTNTLICCSNYIKDGVIEHFGIDKSETLTIYNGCPVDQLRRTNTLTYQSKSVSPLMIGMVARLEGHKDQPTLIRAARLLKDQEIDFQVQLIGEGSRRAEYEALIRAEGVEDCVHLLGMRRDIPQLLNQLDIFVFLAKPDEGLGVALVEAMAARVPVVATSVGACLEVLDGGSLGLLVPSNAPQQLAEAIIQLQSHPEETKLRTQLAYEKVSREFTIEKMAMDYARCLNLVTS